jgi:spore germination cell wall hydrolase CwlJ-like protein
MSTGTPDYLFHLLYVAAKERRRLLKLTLAALMCLKNVIYSEARGEPDEGKQAVAHVITNRSTRENRDICRVANSSQFTRTKSPLSFRFSYRNTDPSSGATYFRNYPGRWRNLLFVKQIGHHYFYKERVSDGRT